MAVVRFAVTCDSCGQRSLEYRAWPSCRECGNDVCPRCYVPDTLETTDGETPETVWCLSCQADYFDGEL